MDTVVVTGSSGTIGTALVERLLSEGFDVQGVDRVSNRWSETVDNLTTVADLTVDGSTTELPRDVDIIVHLAANARVHKLVEDPSLAKENIDSTFTVLEYAREIGADVVFASSREVYGNQRGVVFGEEHTGVAEAESPYTASKISGEGLLNSYSTCYDIEASILRFSNVYGRYDASNRVVPLFIAQAHRGDDLTVFGDDKVLDFTYLDDCVHGIYTILTEFNKAKGETFNIASGRGTSLVELAEMVADRVGTNTAVKVEPNRTGEISRYVADLSKVSSVLGYDPDYTFEAGLESAIDWYEENDHLFEEILGES